jgi:hypothetical protein
VSTNQEVNRVRTLAATLVIAVGITVSNSAPAAGPKLPTRIAQQIVATWTCQDKIPTGRTRAYSPWKPHSQAFRRWQLNTWTQRHRACQAILTERARQWNWQAWLPDKWQRIGACETGYGKRPGNWRHSNSAYQGAFGFAVSSWDAFKLPGYPGEAWQATPWQQYQVALAIKARYGLSGWGCRNA